MDKYCKNCGSQLEEGSKFCSNCGSNIDSTNNSSTINYDTTNVNVNSKSKIAGGLLGIFLGYLGVHNFYLGYTSKGVAQLLLTLIGWILCGIGPVVAGVWGLIEGILILTGSIDKDADGNPLSD